VGGTEGVSACMMVSGGNSGNRTQMWRVCIMVSGGNAGNRTQMWSACIVVSRGNAGNGLRGDVCA